jgi:hypothetical protein
MRKKFQALQKDIEEQREQLALQQEQQRELYTTIKGVVVRACVCALGALCGAAGASCTALLL